MSKTLFVEFRGRGFWAFDVVSGVFLKHLVDAASSCLAGQNHPWLADAVEQWRFNAVISDCGLFLDDGWSAEQLRVFSELAARACDRLAERAEIPADEISSWPMLDGERIFPRGLAAVQTKSLIRFGRALIQLVNGSLPEPPPGTWWFYSTEDAPRTITKRT